MLFRIVLWGLYVVLRTTALRYPAFRARLKFRYPHPYGAALLTARPYRMVKVHNVRMLVFQRSVLVRMAMRLLSLPALVFMSMVFVMDMRMPVLKRFVQVF